MRKLALALLLVATPAQADTFVDIFGGLSIPMGDDEWTDLVESSPKLGLRLGAVPKNLGGFFQVDWTPINSDAEGAFPLGEVDVSAHRFRLQVGGIFRHPLSNTLTFAGRGGVGIDIARASWEGTLAGFPFEGDESDLGIAFEFGAGLWFRVGKVEVGGELGLPFALHDDDDENTNDIDYDYTAYDLDLLFGVRFLSN